MPLATPQSFVSLDHLVNRIANTVLPEDLRDILCFIRDEMNARRFNLQDEQTGFKAASEDELRLAFYHTVNEMVRRMY